MMNKILAIILISLAPNISFSQVSPDTDFNRIELSARELNYQGQPEKAIKIYQTLYSHPAATCLTDGRISKFIAYIYFNQSKKEECMNILLTETLPIWESCTALKKSYLVSPYEKLAEIYLTLKNPSKCLEYSHKIINLYNTGNGRENEYNRLTNAYTFSAAAYSMMGNSKLADKYIEAARYNTLTKVKESNKSFFLYLILDENVRVQLAEENYKSVIDLTHEIRTHITNKNNPLDIYPSGYFALSVNVAKAYLNEGDLKSVKEEIDIMDNYLDDIVSIDAKTQYYQVLSKYESALGNFDKAIAHLDTAQSIATQQSDNSNLAMNKLDLAKIYFNNDKINESDEKMAMAIGYMTGTEKLEILGSSIDLKGKEIYNYDDLFQVLTEFYKMKISLYKKSNKHEDLDQSIAIFDEMDYLVKSSRNTYESEFSQLNHLEKLYGMYEQMIALLVDREETKYHKVAVKYCMDNKSTILANEEKKKGNNQSAYSDADKLLRVKQDRKMFELENEYLTAHDHLKDTINSRYLAEITNSYFLNNQLSQKYPTQKSIESINSNNIDEIIAALANNTALLEVFYGEENVYIFRLLNGNINVQKTALTTDNKQLIHNTINNITTEGILTEFQTQSKTVYDKFFKSLINADAQIEKVIVVADGLFHDLPIETLHDGSGYLIEKHDFHNLYSAQVLLNEKVKSNHSYVGFGTKYTDQLNSKLSDKYDLKNIRLSSLPNAETEIKNGAEIIGGQSYVGDQSKKALFAEKANAIDGILHFALHGLILDEYTSAILFDDRSEEFMLTSSDVYNMNIDNYLSILSACYSADGKIYAGEGVRSLGRAFLSAGSQNIISSLWASSDQANEKIMTSLFHGIKEGNDLPHAFSEAKRAYIKTASPSMQHPSNWGNMVLIGMGDNNSTSFPLWAMGLIGLAIIGGVFFLRKSK